MLVLGRAANGLASILAKLFIETFRNDQRFLVRGFSTAFLGDSSNEDTVSSDIKTKFPNRLRATRDRSISTFQLSEETFLTVTLTDKPFISSRHELKCSQRNGWEICRTIGERADLCVGLRCWVLLLKSPVNSLFSVYFASTKLFNHTLHQNLIYTVNYEVTCIKYSSAIWTK